jgi:hypothetical protein
MLNFYQMKKPKEKNKMNDYEKLYLPFYFNWYEMTLSYTYEEMGRLLRALLRSEMSGKLVEEDLTEKLKVVCYMMLDSAKRTHMNQSLLSEKRRTAANARWNGNQKGKSDANGCKSMQTDAVNVNENVNENVNVNGNGNKKYTRQGRKAQKERYGDFDPEEVFLLALERSYGESFTK